ncbi:YdeI/OmpD-associated family protein [Robertkochia aurantiaca]|uniref:YdeI/OmpD-associated family protein n=1 Tax=Robertkochia aurantiaca TaxID=2873700 RepID=UPI001CCF0B66|nr:YdeI/OmpD-associated family protein [Robertkochia sp. 3YJGBD-33]
MTPEDQIENFFNKHPKWQVPMKEIRNYLLSLELEETFKWGAPVYVYKTINLIGLNGFKNHFGLWFFRGDLIDDSHNVLSNAQKGKTRYMRQWKMTSGKDWDSEILHLYLHQLMNRNEEELRLPKTEKTGESTDLPEELKAVLAQDSSLKESFFRLSPYKQKEFITYLASAKREATRQNRMTKILPMIKEGIGLNDKYR